MEKWEIANRTKGAVEIGCVRSVALQRGERHVFTGSCPEDLRWKEGAKLISLTCLEAPGVAPAPRAQVEKKAEDEQPGRSKSRSELKPQAT